MFDFETFFAPLSFFPESDDVDADESDVDCDPPSSIQIKHEFEAPPSPKKSKIESTSALIETKHNIETTPKESKNESLVKPDVSRLARCTIS